MPAKLPSRSFQLVAGHPALDFVNSLDDRFKEGGPVELLTNYDDLLAFALQAELLTGRQHRELVRLASSQEERHSVLAKALQLREALAAVVYGLLDRKPARNQALLDLENIFKDAAEHRRLVLTEVGGTGVSSLSWQHTHVGEDLRAPVWVLAQAANDLLTSPQTRSIRRCGSETCQWLFLDTSKNHTRRWCDMKLCGNRNKARRFQRRQTQV